MNRGGSRHPLIELTLTRVREFVREPEALFWAFVFPILMSVALAIAFPGGGRPAVVGVEPGPSHDAARRALAAAPGITVKDLAPSEEAAALREGTVHLAIVPTEPPVYRFDPSREESRVARLVVDEALKNAAGRVDPWRAREEAVHTAGSRYVDWLIPGLIAMNIMGTSMWGLGFSIVYARMRHLLKRLMASPMKRHEYLGAQVLARLAFLAPEVIVPLAFGVLALGMPVKGSVPAIAIVCVVGALAFGSVGLLAASRARTMEAISGIMNVSMLPMWIVSGVFFSATNFPAGMQPFIQALPLTALVNALRAVTLEGAPLIEVRGELLILAGWTVMPFLVALRVFRWR